MWKLSEVFLILMIFLPGNLFALQCSRYPPNTAASKSPVDENFVLSITGNAQTYILGQSYNISLQSYNGRRFMNAKVVLENSEGDHVFNDELGLLEVIDPNETKYSPNCSNMIETTNMNYKTRMDMVWVAPATQGVGCVLIRATVLQHRDVWYMDDGALTKRVCEESVDDIQSKQRDDEGKPCCACDEARYEIAIEGTWSRNLHPNDFPTKGWLTRFSDIMGAAHTSDYRFWDNGVLASSEMREFAEHASTRGLEREFNRAFKEQKVRTILKARGPAFPFMNIPSIASMRVDPWHHQFSIASKIVPSPDWIIGVTGLELCLRNCTWLEETSINLYPWDVGTDAGPSYTSPDQPQLPADVIRRISSKFPADIRSPFFDADGVPMKPMAILTVRRQRLYDRKCIEEESNNPEDLARECRTHPWTEWSRCSTNCGQGTQSRFRVFKQPDMALIYNCDTIVDNHQVRPCVGSCTNTDIELMPGEDEDTAQYGMGKMMKSGRVTAADCRLGDWGEWSECNATCGAGLRMRKRELLDQNVDDECLDLEERFEYRSCFNRKCSGQRKIPIPIVGSNRGNDDYRNIYNVDQEVQPDNDDMYSPRYNNQYAGGARGRGRGEEDSNDYNNNYSSQQYPRKGSRNQQSERLSPYDTTDIDQQQYNYPYDQGRDQDDLGRQQRPQQRNRYNNDEYDINGSPGDTYDFNRPQSSSSQQYNQYNRPSYGQGMEEDNFNRQRYRTQDNDLDDPLESLGEPYNFPAESLKQEQTYDSNLPKVGSKFQQSSTRGNTDFQYLNSPVKESLTDTDSSLALVTQKNPTTSNVKYQDYNDAMPREPPSYCYQPLTIGECSDTRVIGNFWFYNHCTDECMLYAVDICDHNLNRFPSLEQCEDQCAEPSRNFPELLWKKQQSAAHCQGERGKRQWKGQRITTKINKY